MAERQRRDRREEAEEQEATQEQPKKSGAVVKVAIIMVVMIILAGGGIGGWFAFQKWEGGRDRTEEPAPQIGPLWSMGTLIVNLLDDGGERYLKVAIELELSSPDMKAELDVLRPKVLDGILELLSSKYYREIVGFEGRQHLRDEITLRVNNYLTRGRITQVYFTDFVIQ